MKILIITVGNRQIGWRCKDGQIRCPGDSRAIDALYQELGTEKVKTSRFHVRHLGKILYDLCFSRETFESVELLMDQKILETQINRGLDTVWLIATDQDDSKHQDSDTCWLALLMEGKIKEIWPNLSIQIQSIKQNPADVQLVGKFYQSSLIPTLIDLVKDQENTDLYLQTKGSTPAMSTGLELYAATLSRTMFVTRLTPQLPEPNSSGVASFSEQFEVQLLSDYFLPLEHPKIISAWERGEFGEAKVILEVYRSRYKMIYKLAGCLEEATRQDIKMVLKQQIKCWPKEKVAPEWRDTWKWVCKSQNLEKTATVAWESAFQIPIHGRSRRWTDGFFLMAQVLERLLYQLYHQDDWRTREWIELTPDPNGGFYVPRLEQLISVWTERYGRDRDVVALDAIRKKRNKIVHDAATTTKDEIEAIWNQAGWPIADPDQMLLEPLKPIAAHLNLPDRPLLTQLYDWGLEQLRAP